MKRPLIAALALCLALALAACGGPSGPSGVSSLPAPSGEASSMPESETPSASALSSQPPASQETPVRVAALKGPTAMGMVKLMDDGAGAASPRYEFTIAASADELTPRLVQGDVDICALPANLASVLYNNTEGQIQVLAVNTLGVLYIVESGDTVHSVEDLRGKTIYSSGKGSTPEYALRYMLSQNGVDPDTDVAIEWKSEHAECVAALSAGEGGIAMLPQPFVTTAQMKNESIRVALDLTAEWEKLSSKESPATLITGVVVARREFAEAHPDLVNGFLSAYHGSVDYVNQDTQGAAALVGKFDIVPEAVAQKALPQCNITYIVGDEMKEKLSGYLQALFDQNPKAVGGALPQDDFYYAYTLPG